MKILHCADLHLDTAFTSLHPDKALARRQEMRDTFSAMMQYIRTERIDLLLISGDLFDTPTPKRETLSFLQSEFNMTPFCRVFIAPGNHDYYNSAWEEAAFPETVTVFREPCITGIPLDELNATVWGWGFDAEKLPNDPLRGFFVPDQTRVNILCAHCDLDVPQSLNGSITKAELGESGLDYAALGHVHNPVGMKKTGTTCYAYAGCLEGRGFDETGIKGAYLLTMDKKNGACSFHAKRVRFCQKHYEDDLLNVSGAQSILEIGDAIRTHISASGYDRNTLLRLTLTGKVSADAVVSIPYLEQQFDHLFYIEIVNDTHPQISAETLESDPTIRGAFFRQLKDSLTNGTDEELEVARMALELGLKALDGEEPTI